MTESAEAPVAALEPVSIPERLDMSGYWAANVRLITRLLLIWFAVTFLTIKIVRQLNQVGILTAASSVRMRS
jgi:uncharacterized membrane protein